MKINKLKLFIFLIAFLYLSNFASASFGIYSEDDSLKVCQCSTFTDEIKLKNTGSQATVYDLSSNLDFVEVNPSDFTLLSGEIKDVNLIIKAPCKKLEKEIEISVSSSRGDDSSFSKRLITGKCQNLKTELYVSDTEIKPCESVDYNIVIYNTGLFKENYSVTSNKEDYIQYSKKSVEIDSKESETINAELTLPCDLYGDENILFTIKAENNKLESVNSHKLLIEKAYDYQLRFNSKNTFCEEDESKISIEIMNLANLDNNYTVELINAPKFIKVPDEEVSVDANKRGSFDIVLEPEEGAALGDHEFTLKITSKYGEISKESNVSVTLNDCYKIRVEFTDETEEMCSEDKLLSFKVMNEGLEKETVALSATPDWVRPATKSVTLNPGSEKELSVIVEPENKDGTYELTVQAQLTSGLVVSDSKEMKVFSQETCHLADIDKTIYSIRRDSDEGIIPIKITNLGRFEEKYELELESGDWLELAQTTVELAIGETKTVEIISSPTEEIPFGEYELVLTIKTDDASYEKEIILELKDKPWEVKAYNYFSTHPSEGISVLLLIALAALVISTFAIKKPKKTLNKKNFRNMIILMVLAMVLFTSYVYNAQGLPYLNKPIDYSEASATHYIWSQGEAYKLDLSSIVSDPDADDLTIEFVDDIDELELTVEEGKIVFTPDPEWYGTVTASIKATDSKNASAESPELTFEVVQWTKYTFMTAYEKLSWYANLLLLLLNFVFVGIIVQKKVKRR